MCQRCEWACSAEGKLPDPGEVMRLPQLPCPLAGSSGDAPNKLLKFAPSDLCLTVVHQSPCNWTDWHPQLSPVAEGPYTGMPLTPCAAALTSASCCISKNGLLGRVHCQAGHLALLLGRASSEQKTDPQDFKALCGRCTCHEEGAPCLASAFMQHPPSAWHRAEQRTSHVTTPQPSMGQLQPAPSL